MGIRKSSVWCRLKIALDTYSKYVNENRDKAQIDKAGRRVKRLVYLLEKYNKATDVAVSGFHE